MRNVIESLLKVALIESTTKYIQNLEKPEIHHEFSNTKYYGLKIHTIMFFLKHV